MSYTMTDLMTKLRVSLLDTTVAYLWPDATLNQAILDAVNEHSFFYPRSARTLYDTILNQQEWTLYPLSGVSTSPSPTSDTDLIAVIGVEFPVGTPIPLDAWGSTAAAGSTSSRTANGYRWTDNSSLRLRVPAAAPQVGTQNLAVFILQTWNAPNDAGSSWNGPNADVSLLLLLAQRAAYQQLQAWQAREQGLTAAVVASSNINLHLDFAPILASLEIQIKRAMDLRAARTAWTPALQGK